MRRYADSWLMPLASLALALAAMVALHYDAAARAVALWWDSPTYSFAFLIAPLSIYLVAMKGRPTPPARPLPALAVLHLPILAVWFLAVTLEVIEFQQFALLGAIYVTIVSILGFRVALHHAVALLLLVFLVPSGQFLVPILQHMSADMSVVMLRAWGVPLFQDDLVIQLPESAYFVAPGCAGLNFVLVSIVLGLVVGELFYKGVGKRVAVVAGLVGVALIANPIRIFAIIAVDYATNRTTDIVSDHLTYGWAFFAAVLAIALPVALQFRDEIAETGQAPAPEAVPPAPRRLAVTAVLGIALAALGPLGLMLAGGQGTESLARLPGLPASLAGAQGQVEPWRRLSGRVAEGQASYPLAAGGSVRLQATLRLAPTPERRLLEAWPPPAVVEESQLERRHVVAIAGGSVSTYATATDGDRRFWAVCFLVDGQCLADGGAYRRAMLQALPGAPLGAAGVLVASMPQPYMANPRAEASFRPLVDALDQATRSLGPALRGR